MKTDHREGGVALITVMLVFVLCAVIVAAIFTRQQQDTQRAANMIDQAQSYQLALGAEELARQELTADALLAADVDYPQERWARLREGIAVSRGGIVLKLEDMQGRFNLNTIAGSEIQAIRFGVLLDRLGIAKSIVSRIVPPLTHISELRQVEGVTPEAYVALMPYVTVMPERESALNVNTAPDLVLQAYFPAAKDYERMKTALSRRGYMTEAELNAIGMSTKGMSVRSRYFQLTAEAQTQGRYVTLVSTLLRKAGANGVTIRVLSRDLGQHFQRVS